MSQTIKGLTTAGQALKAKLEAYGAAFGITRIVAGAAASEDPLALTDIPSPKQEFFITKREQQGASAILRTKLTNEGLDEGYSMWIIGIYAAGPDTSEILYRVIQFDSPRPVPPRSDAGFSYTPTFYITAANSEMITVEINPDWTDEAAAEAQARADAAYQLAEEAIRKAAEAGKSGIDLPDIPIPGARISLRLINAGKKWKAPWPSDIEDEWPEGEPTPGFLLTADGQKVSGKIQLEDGTLAELTIIPENSGK